MLLRSVRYAPAWKTYYTFLRRNSTTVNFNSNVQLHRQRTGSVSSSAPLVLFFPWINAPKSAVEKYRDLYHKIGLDVLVIQGELSHFMWPAKGLQMTKDLLDKLHTEDLLVRENYVVQGMSIGAFIYTMVLMNYSKTPQKFQGFPDKIQGQIFDSIVIGGLGKMSTGIASSASNNKILQTLISSSAGLYFALTKRYTVEFYSEAVEAFYKMPVKSPSLFFYSYNDPMCDVGSLGHLVDTWKSDGCHVVEKSWTKSPHAGHLRRHPDEYISVHSAFLKEIGVSNI